MHMIRSIQQLDLNRRYSYADYLSWQLDEMVELIRGKVFRMSPAPGTAHQRVSGELFFQIKAHLRGHSCQVFAAPFDVRLSLPMESADAPPTDTVVQPDLSVVCDPGKLDERGCQGAPDWIIEILSQSTAPKDFHEKFDLYQQAGVREYWIVHPHEQTVLPYVLDAQGTYQLPRQRAYTREESVPVRVFPGFEVVLEEVFG